MSLSADTHSLAERIVSCLPAASFEMETLCRLARIEPSHDVPSAAVTCDGRPRLLVNPNFVERHCRTDDHLFMLVMHELYHVILGHTGLYPRPTPAHNIAFDAVINAALSQEFRQPDCLGFFTGLNPADTFPGLLLRPPEGWPHDPCYPDVGPAGTAALLARLYPPGEGADIRLSAPTYEEILQLLREEAEERPRGDGREKPGSGAGERSGDEAGATEPPAGADDPAPHDPVLVGNHDDPEADEDAMRDPVLGDTVRRIVARWPPPPVPLAGRDAGRGAQDWSRVLGPCPGDVRRAFARLLRRALGPRPGRRPRRTRAEVEAPMGRGVLPDLRDRTKHARRLLGAGGLLWEQRGRTRARVPERPSAAHVYLDVSGSMSQVLEHLLDLLRPYAVSGEAEVFQFSTEVSPLPARDLARGKVRTTFGTGIDCVLEHLLEAKGVRRALIVTDGYTGTGRSDLLARLEADGVRLHAVLPAESAWERDLAPIAASMTVLPPLYPGAAPGRARP